MRRFFALTLFLFPLAGRAASDAAARLAADYRAALEIACPETPELALHDALGRLCAKPDDLGDLDTVRASLDGVKDETLHALLQGMLVLGLARDGLLERYFAEYAAFRDATANPQLVKAADVSSTLVVCPECGGENRCGACGGSLKCQACKGKGYTLRRPAAVGTSSSSSSSSRTLSASLSTAPASQKQSCTACRGSGKCPSCKGVQKICRTCLNKGKSPDAAKVTARLGKVAESAHARSATLLAEALSAREQTALLAADLRKIQAISDPGAALKALEALPEERITAVQWSQVVTLKTDLAAIVQEREETSSAKQAERQALRAAIAQAQRAADPLAGMEQLLPLFDRYAACDALPEVQTALDGLLASLRTQQEARVEALERRIASIGGLMRPEDRLSQAEDCLAHWPELELSKTLREAAKTDRLAGLAKLTQDSRLETLRSRVEGLRTTADRAVEEKNANPAWWIWAIAGGGGLLAVYALYAAIRNMAERRAEAARLARQRAAIDNIRSTFSHRRGR